MLHLLRSRNEKEKYGRKSARSIVDDHFDVAHSGLTLLHGKKIGVFFQLGF
jgi:hypothetical protein